MWYRLAKQLSSAPLGGGIRVKKPSNDQKAETPREEQELEERALEKVEEQRGKPSHQTLEEKLGKTPNRDGEMGVPTPKGLGDLAEVLPSAIHDQRQTATRGEDTGTGSFSTQTFFENPDPRTRGRL